MKFNQLLTTWSILRWMALHEEIKPLTVVWKHGNFIPYISGARYTVVTAFWRLGTEELAVSNPDENRTHALRLIGSVTTPNDLTDAHRDRMYELMAAHFDNVDRATFETDLAEKRWVVLLRDRLLGEIQGFSTLMLLDAAVAGEPIKAVFSGDTIVHRDYWGETELANVWGKFIFSLIQSYRGSKFYWFLISKGYRTYKFLPVYFKDFFPRYDRPTPAFEEELMATLAELKFPGHFDRAQGILRFDDGKDRLTQELADVSELRMNHPHTRFFHEKNPGYVNGDELVCLAELSEENLQPIAARILSRGAEQTAIS